MNQSSDVGFIFMTGTSIVYKISKYAPDEAVSAH